MMRRPAPDHYRKRNVEEKVPAAIRGMLLRKIV
jgi:hypothetical protein